MDGCESRVGVPVTFAGKFGLIGCKLYVAVSEGRDGLPRSLCQSEAE